MQKLNRTFSLLVALGAALVVAHALPACATDLTGTYTADDGGIYYVQQSGNVVSWAGMSIDNGIPADQVWHRGLVFTNVFHGTVNADNTVSGSWADVTRGTILQSGTLTVLISTSGSGVIQLTKVQFTGGFGASTWTQINPLFDLKTGGDTNGGDIQDIEERFRNVPKNDGTTLLNPNLKPYRDATVVYGRLINSHTDVSDDSHFVESEIPHVNVNAKFQPPIPGYPDFGSMDRTYSEFLSLDNTDADFDMRLKLDMNRLEPDFWTTGWGARNYGPEIYRLKFNDSSTHEKLNLTDTEAYLGLESVMFGKSGDCLLDTCLPDSSGTVLVPGWSEMDGNSVLVNGQPVNAPVLSQTPPPFCLFVQPCPNLAGETPSQLQYNYLVVPAGIALGNLMLSAYGNGMLDQYGIAGSGDGTYLRVTGPLILDCGHGLEHDCYDNGDDNPDDDSTNVSTHQNQEIHPIYSIDIINYPFRPEDLTVAARQNLTGTWGGSDGSTYYIRQIGNTIWWLGMMRDRQPMQPGSQFPMIGTSELAQAFDAGDPPCTSSPRQCWAFANVFQGTITPGTFQSVIDGDWMGVPQSTSAGSSGGHMQFYVQNQKVIYPATPSVFPITIQKMYEPGDTVAPQNTLTVGSPQFVDGSNQLFVTGTTTFSISGSDLESGVQNVWVREFLQGTASPQYTPVIAATATVSLSGADGTYEVDGYATDNAGNDGTTQTMMAYLDSTPPVATVLQPAATQYGHGDPIVLNYSVSDGAGSGVKSYTPTLDGFTALQFGASLNSGSTIYLYSLGLGTHTFSINSTDNLNHASTNTVTFTIAVTPQSLIGEVNGFQTLGCIDKLGQSLDAKIATAQNLINAGQIQAAINTLTALTFEVHAQAGKHISTTCKDPNGIVFNPVQILLGDVQLLKSTLAAQLKSNPIMGAVTAAGNVGISGATVNLTGSNKAVLATAITDVDGFYYFPLTAGLTVGTDYTVYVKLPKGYKASSPGSQTFPWNATQVALSTFILN